MAVEDTPLDRRISPESVAALALIAAVLSVVIYLFSGHWPAGLSGLGPVFFTGMAVVLFGLGRLHS